MRTAIPTSNRKVDHRFPEVGRGDVESTDTEARDEANEFRNGLGINDTDEWKCLESDQARSRSSIFDLDGILEESDFELDATSGKPVTAADKHAARDCRFR